MATADLSSPPAKAPDAVPNKPPEQYDLRPYLQAMLQKQAPPAKRCGSCPFLDGNDAEIPCKIALAIFAFGSTIIFSIMLFLLLRAYARQ
jgi:hypothetical protein